LLLEHIATNLNFGFFRTLDYFKAWNERTKKPKALVNKTSTVQKRMTAQKSSSCGCVSIWVVTMSRHVTITLEWPQASRQNLLDDESLIWYNDLWSFKRSL